MMNGLIELLEIAVAVVLTPVLALIGLIAGSVDEHD